MTKAAAPVKASPTSEDADSKTQKPELRNTDTADTKTPQEQNKKTTDGNQTSHSLNGNVDYSNGMLTPHDDSRPPLTHNQLHTPRSMTMPKIYQHSMAETLANENDNVGNVGQYGSTLFQKSTDQSLNTHYFPPCTLSLQNTPQSDYGSALGFESNNYTKLPPGGAAPLYDNHIPQSRMYQPDINNGYGAKLEPVKFSRHEEAFSHPEHAFSHVVPNSPMTMPQVASAIPMNSTTHFGQLPLPSLPVSSLPMSETSINLPGPHGPLPSLPITSHTIRDTKLGDDIPNLGLPALPDEPSLPLSEYTKIADQLSGAPAPLNQLDTTINQPLPAPPGVDLSDLPALPNIDMDLPPELRHTSPDTSSDQENLRIKEEPGLYPRDRKQQSDSYSPKIKVTKMRGKEDRKRYEGVYHHKNRWVSKCNINKKQVHVGYFDTLEEAVAARQKILNNPETELPKLMRRRRDFVNNKGVLNAKSSQVRGVSYNAKARKWHAQLAFEGKNFFLGYFKTEAEAAEVRFAAEKNPKDYVTKLKASRPPPAERHSFYTGVSWHSTAQKWRAIIRHNMKTHYLGCFDTEEEAFEARMIAAQNLHLGIDAIKERLLKKKKSWYPGGQARKESRQKGVTRYNRRNEWWARYYDGKRRWFIGSFKTEKEAVEAYMKVSENPQEELRKLKAKKDAKMAIRMKNRNRTKVKKEEPYDGDDEPSRKRQRSRPRKKMRSMSLSPIPGLPQMPLIKQEECYSGPPPSGPPAVFPPFEVKPDMDDEDLPDLPTLPAIPDAQLHDDVKRSWETAVYQQAQAGAI